jgi:hypothetical protein
MGPTNYLTKVPAPAIPAAGQPRAATYIWVCLRRPANLFAPVSATNPMVVVDCARVPYIDGTGATVSTDGNNNPIVIGNFNTIYSMQRFQPYRGGHAVPVPGATPAPNLPVDPRYGFTEQIVTPTLPAPPPGGVAIPPSLNLQTQGVYFITGAGAKYPATLPIFHTLGWANEFEQGAQAGAANPPFEIGDYLPFHDRDFTSVAELMLVPGCPPGLFTKQFIEFAPSFNNVESIFKNVAPWTNPIFLTAAPWGANAVPPAVPTAPNTITWVAPASYATASTPFLANFAVGSVQPQSYPYLADKFFYTAYGQSNTLDPGGLVGGYTGDGWFKMFEFFEVPSQVIGAIGPVAQGTNFDWLRQDLKPGQLNLNLIIDEEVFFGIAGKQHITQNSAQQFDSASGNPRWPSDQFNQDMLNFDQIPGIAPGNYLPGTAQGGFPFPQGTPPIPMVVTSIYADGSPASAYPMVSSPTPPPFSGPWPAPPQPPQPAQPGHNGLLALDPVTNFLYLQTAPALPQPPYSNALKAAFVQFLSLRHGGSGFIFGFGNGAVGQNSAVMPSPPGTNPQPQGALPAERPFHSLSYPDINYTVMRPAALPPSQFTNPAPNPDPTTAASLLYPNNPSTYDTNTPPNGTASPLWNTFSGDPGVRNFSLYVGYPSAFLASNPATLPAGWAAVPQTTSPPGYPGAAPPVPPGGTPPTASYWPVYPPPIPVRRLFQPPDAYNSMPGALPTATTASASNASETGDPSINNLTALTAANLNANGFAPVPPGVLAPPSYTDPANNNYFGILTNGVVNLYWPGVLAANLVNKVSNAITPVPGVTNPYLGSPVAAGQPDFRQHPYWRSEQLQRVMNLTTVRTHQYAVWITIGFFEVSRQGDLGMLAFDPTLAFDILGPEIGAATGKTKRFRGFFLVDRLRLTGFNPASGSAFRSAVVYRQRIQ